ncbi:phage tail protein [Streptomyces sp. NPDC001443]
MRAKKTAASRHAPAASESKAAQDAAVAPPDDKQAQGKAAQAEKMNAAKPGTFDKARFIAAVNQAIAAQAPKNLDEADHFSGSGKAAAVKDQVSGQVSQGKAASAKEIDTTTNAAPDLSRAKDKPVTPLTPDAPPPVPGTPNPAGAVPARQPDAVTDFSGGPRQINEQMADAEVTEDQLARSNEPQFTHALSAKKEGEKHSAAAPGQARGAEAKQLAAAKQGAAAAGAQAMTGLAAARTATGKQVDGGKSSTKSADERRRAEVTARLQKVFDGTKTDVERTLSGLDKLVDERFTAGEKAARDAFTADQKRRMDAYKDKRYSGFTGKLRWVKDKFAGLPAEADALFQESRKLYVAQMQQVISSIADLIGAELGKAKDRISRGRAELRAEVDKLPADLKKFGSQAAKDFTEKFDGLESDVNAKSDQLVQDLAQKYTQALNSVDDEIKKLQEENKGLIAKAKDAVVGVIQTIIELKNLLLGVLAKAASAVMKIIKDPIGFLGNLVTAVGAGLRQFVGNIAEHLKKGLISWLLGAAAGAGLALPAKFDLKGIIQLLAGLLGLTWGNIRARITRKGVPDQAVTAAEQSVPVAQAIQKEGPAGAVEHIKESVGDLKSTILQKLTAYLIPTVIVAGITWITSLLTPASAFVRAVKGIIDLVTFVVTQGGQIIQFVNSILDAVVAIANGGGGGVPALIEGALAASIPVLIGFLAALLGVGNLAGKVRQVFTAVAKPVNKAIDKIVDFIAKAAKKLWAKIRNRGRREKDGNGDPGGKSSKETPGSPTMQEKEKIAAAAAQDAYKRLTSGTSPGRADNALDAVFTKWQKKGLKSLSIKKRGSDSFSVVAKVNPEHPSPEFAWNPNASNVKHLLSFDQATKGGAAWANGSFTVKNEQGLLFGPSKNKPKVAARREATVSNVSHAEETVIARLKLYWNSIKKTLNEQGAAPESVSIAMDIHVGYNCCVKCADYYANFVEELRKEGYQVAATGRFSTFYKGGNTGGSITKPTVVPESMLAKREQLFKLFLGESMMKPKEEGGMLSPADPDRYWGTDSETKSLNPSDEQWYAIRNKREQGLLALAILRSSEIKVDVLDQSHLSNKLSTSQEVELQTRTAILKKAAAEVDEKLKAMKAGSAQ